MKKSGKVIDVSFYKRPDVVQISRDLLGLVLCTRFNGITTSGIINETEAYCGRNDKACHANNGKRTARTEVMFGKPGHSYIYLCYGIHHLFNIVTNREGLADAVLIRSIKPLEGIEEMKKRRNLDSEKNLGNGPGKLSQALGLDKKYSGCSLFTPPVWIEDRGIDLPEKKIKTTRRIGIDYAGKDAEKMWRFVFE